MHIEHIVLPGAAVFSSAPVCVLIIFFSASCCVLNGIQKSISVSDLSFYLTLTLICPLSHSGENPLPPDDPSKEQMGKTEVSLTLANKFDVPGEANVEMDAKTLLLKYVNFVDSRLAN